MQWICLGCDMTNSHWSVHVPIQTQMRSIAAVLSPMLSVSKFHRESHVLRGTPFTVQFKLINKHTAVLTLLLEGTMRCSTGHLLDTRMLKPQGRE